MTNGEHSPIALPDPRRSWLMHCNDANGDLDVCEVAVNNGNIAILPPDDGVMFELEGPGIAEFRIAFDEAVVVAEADRRARAARKSAGAR